MNLDTEYSVEQANGARSGGEWIVWRTCKTCGTRTVAAWFHTKVDAQMWALQKNNPEAFTEFCAKMAGPNCVDPKAWLEGRSWDHDLSEAK